jgi:hypothetical protein
LLVLVDGDVHESSVLRDARIAGRTKHLEVFSSRLSERPNNRMLATAGSDYECFYHRFP